MANAIYNAGAGYQKIYEHSTDDTNYIEEYIALGYFIHNDAASDVYAHTAGFADGAGSNDKITLQVSAANRRLTAYHRDAVGVTSSGTSPVGQELTGVPGTPACDFAMTAQVKLSEHSVVVNSGDWYDIAVGAGDELNYAVIDQIYLQGQTQGFIHNINRWFVLGLGGDPTGATEGTKPLKADIERVIAGEHPISVWGTDSASVPYVRFMYEFPVDERRTIEATGRSAGALVQSTGAYQEVADFHTYDHPTALCTSKAKNLQFTGGVATTMRMLEESQGAWVGSVSADCFYLISEAGTAADAADTAMSANDIIDEATGNHHIYIPYGWYISVFHASNTGVLSIAPTEATPEIGTETVPAGTGSFDVEVPQLKFLSTTIPVPPAASVVLAKPDISTNQVTYSDTLGSWLNSNITTASDDTTAPNGASTADKLTPGAAGANIRGNGVTYIPGTNALVMFSIKKDAIPKTTRFARLEIDFTGSSDNAGVNINFDTSTGENYVWYTGSGASVAARLGKHPLDPDNWWRAILIGNDGDTATPTVRPILYPAAGANADLSVTSAIFAEFIHAAEGFCNADSGVPLRQVETPSTSAVTNEDIKINLGVAAAEAETLYHRNVAKYSKPTFTHSGTAKDYGSIAVEIDFDNTVATAVTPVEDRMPLPSSVGRRVLIASVATVYEQGAEAVAVSDTSPVAIAGEVIELANDSSTHIAFESLLSESGNLSVSGTK